MNKCRSNVINKVKNEFFGEKTTKKGYFWQVDDGGGI